MRQRDVLSLYETTHTFCIRENSDEPPCPAASADTGEKTIGGRAHDVQTQETSEGLPTITVPTARSVYATSSRKRPSNVWASLSRDCPSREEVGLVDGRAGSVVTPPQIEPRLQHAA